MAIIAFTENVEFADWVDEDDIDIRGLTIPEDESDVKMPVYSMNEHMSSPWKEKSLFNIFTFHFETTRGPHREASELRSDDEDDTWVDTFLSELSHHINDRTLDHRFC
ncbi:hypothetical protein AVEN_170343-1 [Araneus ventricosus]|uniref:Uncharacterized protein n=1 Tax=Araneus ventricosus TaxID=182803 RepID=A0A4Y2CA30_ARAVE|nr:hypothetical protein AVEN_170343-1 [Araneus ventricosus]